MSKEKYIITLSGVPEGLDGDLLNKDYSISFNNEPKSKQNILEKTNTKKINN